MTEHGKTGVRPPATDDTAPSRVVVGVDGTAANRPAVAWAVVEARRTGRPLVLVASAPNDTPASTPRTANLECDHLERLTRDLLKDVRARITDDADVDVSTHVAAGGPSRSLVEVADPDDLLVVGRRCGHPLTHALQGSTSIAVAGRSKAPVVVVPDTWTVTEHVSAPIVAGIDAHHDPLVLDHAFDRARTVGVQLVVVDAWELPAPHTRSAAEIQRWAATARTELAGIIAPWKENYPDVIVTTESHPLTPAAALLAAATDAQLVVVGRHTGPHHLGGLGLGSTTRKILHHARCPVLVVPETPIDRCSAEGTRFDDGDLPEY